jgi:hypothetical protein
MGLSPVHGDPGQGYSPGTSFSSPTIAVEQAALNERSLAVIMAAWLVICGRCRRRDRRWADWYFHAQLARLSGARLVVMCGPRERRRCARMGQTLG